MGCGSILVTFSCTRTTGCSTRGGSCGGAKHRHFKLRKHGSCTTPGRGLAPSEQLASRS